MTQFDITPYRQPMITSLGILMGFLLNFIAGWATSEDDAPALVSLADYVVAISMLVALVLMTVVLARLLSPQTPSEAARTHYQTTFRMYLSALALTLGGFGAALVL
jgi:hypothetical protein